MSNGRYIAVDLDATLAYYNGGGIDTIGPPIPAMVERVKRWLDEGRDVRIFTARVSGPAKMADEQRALIQDWCERHLGRRLPVTCTKDFCCDLYVDDRAIGVVPNTGLRTDGQDWNSSGT